MFELFLFAAVLGVLIVGHEFGHFIAARLSGIQVDEFGLGFPPRLATLFKAGGTRFTINMIPLGGFVRPAGENDPEVPGGLAGAPKRSRVFVLLSGPAANIILAIIAFTAAYKFAAPDPERVLITAIAPNSPAEAAGLQNGDLILSVDGAPVNGFEALQVAVAAKLGESIDLLVEREDAQVLLQLTPRESPPEGEGPIGVLLGHQTRKMSTVAAISLGWQSTWGQFGEMIRLPGRLLQGQVSTEDARVSGLKGMYDMLAWATEIDRSSQRPFLTLNLIAVISAGLALANLLPFPALDGGRLMFVFIEAILGRRINPQYEGLAHAVGFAILLALMVYVNFQDFINPISLPR